MGLVAGKRRLLVDDQLVVGIVVVQTAAIVRRIVVADGRRSEQLHPAVVVIEIDAAAVHGLIAIDLRAALERERADIVQKKTAAVLRCLVARDLGCTVKRKGGVVVIGVDATAVSVAAITAERLVLRQLRSVRERDRTVFTVVIDTAAVAVRAVLVYLSRIHQDRQIVVVDKYRTALTAGTVVIDLALGELELHVNRIGILDVDGSASQSKVVRNIGPFLDVDIALVQTRPNGAAAVLSVVVLNARILDVNDAGPHMVFAVV